MTDSVRLQILKAISATIAQVSPAHGYANDLSVEGAVARGRLRFGDGDPIPMVSILESPRQPAPDANPRPAAEFMGWWDLLIQGWAEDDKTNPTDPAHSVMAEVKKALSAEWAKLEGNQNGPFGFNCITGLKMDGGVVRPPDEFQTAKAYFWLPISIRLLESYTDPFTP